MKPLAHDGVLIAIDPGKHMGWAIFVHGALGLSGAADGDTLAGFPRELIPTHVIVEYPTFYPYSGVDPNDLIKLSFRAGRAASAFPVTPILVEPRTWKHNTPKQIHHKRIRVLLGLGDRLPSGHNPDQWDAIGLGLWALGRRG